MPRVMLTDHDYIGRSVSRVIRAELRVLAKFAYGVVRGPFARRRALQSLGELAGTQCGRPALVIGLGPSTRKLDADKVTKLQASGLVVFAMNRFFESYLATKITPDFYVLADPHFFGNSKHADTGDREREVWAYLDQHPDVKVAIPHDSAPDPRISSDRIIRFNALGLEGFTKNISPMRPRGFMSMTSYHALSIAGHLGFDRIYIIGIDNTQFRSLVLSPNREVALGENHFYTTNQREPRVLPYFHDGVRAFFEDVARLFNDLHYFKKLPILNLDSDSLVDAFPVAEDAEQFRGSSDIRWVMG